MNSGDINVLPLHDAVLRSVAIDWELKSCRFNLVAFSQPGASAMPHVLEFSGVTSLHMPHAEPWGPSSSINSASCSEHGFRIEMQSGDVIEVDALHFTFTAL
jgi:hypothetical protein